MAVSTTADVATPAPATRNTFNAWPPNLATDLTNQCRWRYVPGTSGWRECQHGHSWPPAAVMAKRAGAR